MGRKYSVAAAATCVAALMVGVSGCGGDGGRKSGGDKHDSASSSAGPVPQQSPPKPKGELDGLPAKEISDKAKKELQSASAVRIKLDRDKSAAGPAMHAEYAMDKQGNCVGRISQDDAGFEMLKRGDEYWIKPDENFWRKNSGSSDPETASKLLSGHWFHGNSKEGDGGPFKESGPVCQLDAMQQKLAKGDDDESADKFTKGAPTALDGQQVVPVTITGKSVINVAAEGKPYPVRIVSLKPGGGTTAFSDWEKPVTVTPPPADQTLDVSKLKQSRRA